MVFFILYFYSICYLEWVKWMQLTEEHNSILCSFFEEAEEKPVLYNQV